MEQNNDNNHLYTLIKHCNEFLYRRDDYRIPSDSQSDHSNNENILKTMNDSAGRITTISSALCTSE